MLRISIDRHKSRCLIESGACKSIRIKNITLLLFSILAWHAKLMANTIKASSSSLRDVQGAIDSAGNDDTVIVPDGTDRWTSTLVIDKPIALIGQTSTDPVAGTAIDKTIIQDDVARLPGGAPIIKIISVLDKKYRVSGLTFQGFATTKNNNGAIQLTGNSHGVRLDHCHFQPLRAQGPYVAIMGSI
jgi:hypothetical protein